MKSFKSHINEENCSCCDNKIDADGKCGCGTDCEHCGGQHTVDEGGLWDNIHAKRKRIKNGSGEKMKKPGSKGAPTDQDFKDASESVELDEISASDKKHMAQMYDKKGNLTPLGKRVMDHGKKAADAKVADKARRKEYNAYQKSKRNEEVEDYNPYASSAKKAIQHAKANQAVAKARNNAVKTGREVDNKREYDKKQDAKAKALRKEAVELDEAKFSPSEVKMAIGIASDKRYKGGNMTGAIKAMDKMKPGISNHPQVAAVLKRQNEDMNEAGPRHTTIPMNKRFGSGGRDSKKFDIYKKHMKKTDSDESTVRMIADNPSDPESKRMMKNKDIAKGVELYKASFKEEVELDEAPRRKGAPKMTGDSIAIQRAKDNAHDNAMGRTNTGRKKPVRAMTSTQKSLASMRKEEVELDKSTINDITAMYINENNITVDQLENMTEEELNELIGKAIGGAFKLGAKAVVGSARLAKKGAQRMSTSGRADAAEKRADSIEKKNADRKRSQDAKARIVAAKAAAKNRNKPATT